MLKKIKKGTLILMLTFFITTIANAIPIANIVNAAEVADKNIMPRQVNVHMGDDPSSQVNITYTTKVADLDTTVTLNKLGSTDKEVQNGEASLGAGEKYFHRIFVNNLEADTTYEYTIGSGVNSFSGKFKTAPAKGNKDSFKFVYLADPQVHGTADAKAAAATFQAVNNLQDISFVYLAGDLVDNIPAYTEDRNLEMWKLLFENKGAYPNGAIDMFGNNTIAAVVGGHDRNTFYGQITAPSQGGEAVYSFDYGPATFIMLNTDTAENVEGAKEEQKAFLTEKVKDAKARGQWVIVGFHMALYSGGTSVDNDDIKALRTFWSPILADLDVDIVLQGHDHVYSRGFVTGEGKNANPIVNEDGTIQVPENAPLYMVGGTAGGYKWYTTTSYTVSEGDPLTPNYEFLDLNSVDRGSYTKKEQTFIEVEVSQEKITFNTYNFKYDTDTDEIVTDKYLYDSISCVRNSVSDTTSVEFNGPESYIVENGGNLEYVVSSKNNSNVRAYNITLEYDATVLDFVEAENLLEKDNAFVNVTGEDGSKQVVATIMGANNNTDINKDLVKFSFKPKEGVTSSSTEVKIKNLVLVEGTETGVQETEFTLDKDTINTNIIVVKEVADIDNSGVIDLLDLATVALEYNKTVEDIPGKEHFDINKDGVINIVDLVLISREIES